jgi:hypothetical protein
VVILRVLVGRRTGPLTRRSLPLARSISSVQTFSRDWTLREVRVMRILWVFCNYLETCVSAMCSSRKKSNATTRGSQQQWASERCWSSDGSHE